MKKRAKFDLESFKRLQETKESLQRVESFPYSEDLRSVMDTQVYTCPPDKMAKEVLQDMAARNISSAIIVDHDEHPIGIITERDVMQRILATGCLGLETIPVAKFMTQGPVILRPDNSIYRALSVLTASGIKHLPLVENDRVVGIVTMRQLLKLRYPEPMTLIEGIREAEGTATLKAFKSKIPTMVKSRLESGRRASDIVVMISLVNRDIHRRALELELEKLGRPPVPFCLYLTGSHGRLENLLAPDQDHGMIIADNDGEYQYDQYYIDLTVRFTESLDRIGFQTCPGYIMASNPLWRKSLTEWKQQILYWYERQVPELGRFTTVLFDAAAVYGETELFKEMQDFAFSVLKQHNEVLRVLHEEEGGHKVPTGFWGRFITEPKGAHRGELDVKRSGLIFILEAVRILALKYGIRKTTTLKRIQQLVEQGFMQKDDGQYFESAYHVLLHLTLSAQVDKAMAGQPLDTFINPAALSRRDRETLRHSFKAVSYLQGLVASEFGELVL